MAIIEMLRDYAERVRNPRKYKDRFFRLLFGNDKQALLDLYNALNGTDYTDVKNLDIVTVLNSVELTGQLGRADR